MTTNTVTIVPEGVYTLREACDFLRISDATARRWIKEGRLRARKVGRSYRLLGGDLIERLQEPLIEPPRRFGPDSPLLALAGIGESAKSDVAEHHDRYLAENYRREHM